MKAHETWSEIRSALDDRAALESVWQLCIRMVRGFQRPLTDDALLRNIAGIGANSPMDKLTFNKTGRLFKSVVSALQTEWPAANVLPASDHTDDVLKARSNVDTLRYYWNVEKIDRKLARMAGWLVATGNAGLHTFYDPATDAVTTEPLAATDILLPYGYEEPSDSPWVAARVVALRDAVKASFPTVAKAVDKAKPAKRQGGVDQKDNELRGSIAYWCVYHADGTRQLILDGGELLYEDEYPEGDRPIQLIRFSDIPGETYGVGMVEPIIQTQLAFNRTLSRGIAVADLLGNPAWWVETGSMVGGQEFHNRPGAVYKGAPGANPPQMLSGAALPPDYYQMLQVLDALFLDLAGTPSSFLGQHARGITSGSQANTYVKQATNLLMTTQGNIVAAVEEMAATVLVLMKAYYTETRFLRMFDRSGSLVYREVQATDIVDVPEVFIEADSLFRQGTMDRRQRVLELHAAGLMNAHDAMQELALNTSDKWALDKVAALAHARDMLDGFLQGQELVILPGDDLEAFDRVWREYLQTREFGMFDPESRRKMVDAYMVIARAKAGNPTEPLPADKATMPAPSPAPVPFAGMDDAVTAEPAQPDSTEGLL